MESEGREKGKLRILAVRAPKRAQKAPVKQVDAGPAGRERLLGPLFGVSLLACGPVQPPPPVPPEPLLVQERSVDHAPPIAPRTTRAIPPEDQQYLGWWANYGEMARDPETIAEQRRDRGLVDVFMLPLFASPEDNLIPQSGRGIVAGQLEARRLDDGWLEVRMPELYRAPPRTQEIEYWACSGEKLDEVAKRYGVKAQALRELNHINARRAKLRKGQRLRIRPNRYAPPRLSSQYRVQSGETWSSIASGLGESEATLRKRNGRYRRRKLKDGDRLEVCPPSRVPTFDQWKPHQGDILLKVPYGAESVGTPNSGRLWRGVQLPESPHYTLGLPGSAYASTNTIAQLQYGFETFRRRTGFRGKVLITSLSRRRGGFFPPHKSHQSGRDVDVALVAFPGFRGRRKPSDGRVDWGATWALMRAFIDTGQVEYIFLSYQLQKHLYRAARLMGETPERLERLIQYPRRVSQKKGLVRHSPGHDRHFHLRFHCGPQERRCR